MGFNHPTLVPYVDSSHVPKAAVPDLPLLKRNTRVSAMKAPLSWQDEGSDSDKASVDTSVGSSLVTTGREEDCLEEVSEEWPWELISPGNWRVRNTFLHNPLNRLTLLQIFQRRRRAWSVPAGGREAAEREEAARLPVLTPVGEDPLSAADWARSLVSTEGSSTPRSEVEVQIQPESTVPSIPPPPVAPELLATAYSLRVRSEGSVGHAQGLCKPCAFFWKDVGCKSGTACQFCHECEPDERKRRNREKRASVQFQLLGSSVPSSDPLQLLGLPGPPSAPPSAPPAVPPCAPPAAPPAVYPAPLSVSPPTPPPSAPPSVPPAALAQEAPCHSLGSAGHALGKCKPCAFFGKGVGCNNGASCQFCHICGADERKRRSKEKKEHKMEEQAKRLARRSS